MNDGCFTITVKVLTRNAAVKLTTRHQITIGSILLVGLTLVSIFAFTQSHKLSSLAPNLRPDSSQSEEELRKLYIYTHSKI